MICLLPAVNARPATRTGSVTLISLSHPLLFRCTPLIRSRRGLKPVHFVLRSYGQWRHPPGTRKENCDNHRNYHRTLAFGCRNLSFYFLFSNTCGTVSTPHVSRDGWEGGREGRREEKSRYQKKKKRKKKEKREREKSDLDRGGVNECIK